MSGFLAKACAEAADRVAEARRLVPLQELREAPAHDGPSLADALSAHGVGVIAELKRASPSKGHLAWIPDPVARALAYRSGGAVAISVLTEPAHFRGTLADLAVVSAAVDAPTIRKDFLVDPYQVWEARQAGAAAVLVIVAALSDEVLCELVAEADIAGLDVLVEIHDDREAQRAADAYAAASFSRRSIVGVNARDLSTLQVDPGRFAACVQALPEGSLAVAESGISGPGDMARVIQAGADAVLVGEHAVTAKDPAAVVRSLVSVCPPAIRSVP